MKACPNCGELIGDDVQECFNCHYNYIHQRVMTSEEIAKERDKKQQEIVEKTKEVERRQKAEEEQLIKEQLLLKERKEKIEQQIKRNPKYEYKIITIDDTSSGSIDSARIQKILNQYSEEGWKLHSAFTNELGKNSSSTSIGHMGSGTNATIDQTVLIFERCIDAGNNLI